MTTEDSEDLLRWAKQQCRKYKVKFRRHKSKYILCDGFPVSGYFDSTSKELHFAASMKGWQEVLCHETCHVIQWGVNTPIWQEGQKAKCNVGDWLKGEKVPTKHINQAIVSAMYVEKECEKWSADKLAAYKDFDKKNYTRKANSYILFYLFVKDQRKWCKKGKAPYSIENIWTRFPATFNIDIDKTYNKLKHLYHACI
jgi:hypothetical protein